MSQTITLDGPADGMRKLYEAYEFGASPERLGLVDAANATAHHMGSMLERMRSLHEARVTELRERNLADAEPERPVGSEENTR
jgi:hypothetical protein